MRCPRARHALAPLATVIAHHRKVIARGRLFARQDDVTPYFRRRGNRPGPSPAAGFGPGQRSGSRDCRRHIESQRVWLARRHPAPAFGGAERARGAGIERRTVGIARPRRMPFPLGDEAGDLAARLEAWIDQLIEPRQRRSVIVEMRALAPHRLLPPQAEPVEIFIDRLLVVRSAARRIDVLDAQQKTPAHRARHFEVDQRGERVAEVQIPIRARRKPEDGCGHARPSGPRKGLRCHRVCRCFAALMFFIHTEADLEHAIARLVHADPRFGAVLSRAGRPPLRRRPDGFSGLASIVVSQQLSTASAKAIWARLKEAFDPFDHAAVLRARSPRLARAGLSGAKIRTLKAIAKAIDSGELDLPALADMPADEAHAALTAVHGIGPWTADIYLLFCLGHADAWPAGDLALQEAAKLVLALKTRPTAKEMAPLAERWRPWRGAAAYMLWTHYRATKQRDGAPIPATTNGAATVTQGAA